MKISIGTFAKNFNQSKIVVLVHEDKNRLFYSIKLPFRKFILLILKN